MNTPVKLPTVTAPDLTPFVALLDSLLSTFTDDEKRVALAFIAENEPKNSIEVMQLTQIFVTQKLSARFVGSALAINHPEVIDRSVNRFCKLNKRFNESVETFNRGRGVSSQEIVVKRIDVSQGGQVAFVAGGENGRSKG